MQVNLSSDLTSLHFAVPRKMAFQGSKILLYLLAVFVAVQASPVSYFQPVEGPHDIFYANVHDIPRSTEHHILKPRSHPDHDASDHVHLLPDETKDLFWSQSSMNGKSFIRDFLSSDLHYQTPSMPFSLGSKLVLTE